MNNSLQLMQMIRNPQAFIQNMMNNRQAMQNPIISNAMQMYQKGDVDGINKLAKNIAKEKGVNINQLTQQIKSQFGL